MSNLPPPSGRQLLRGGCVITQDARLGDFDRADVLIENGLIKDIAQSINATDAVIVDATDRIVAPGFVDSHRHLWEGLLRNIVPDASLFEYMMTINGAFAPLYTPEDVYTATLISALGALNAGVTTVLDWSQIQNTPSHTDAAIAALGASGARAIFGFGPPNGGVKPGDFTNSDEMRRIARSHFSSKDQLLGLALAAVGPEFLPMEYAAAEWNLAKDLDVRIAVHVGNAQAGTFGKLAAFSQSHGLNDRTTYIHCNTLSDHEWDLIADTGGKVSVSSTIEMGMGHGHSSIQRALDRGLGPSLSVDVETSTPGDFFTQMRSVFSVQRAAAHAAAAEGKDAPPFVSAREVLSMATIEGAKANGLSHLTGSLSIGKQADLILLRTDLINVMPLNDAFGAILGGMDTSNVDSVMVAGKFVKWRGVLVDVDLPRLLRSASAARDSLIARAGGKVSPTSCIACRPMAVSGKAPGAAEHSR